MKRKSVQAAKSILTLILEIESEPGDHSPATVARHLINHIEDDGITTISAKIEIPAIESVILDLLVKV